MMHFTFDHVKAVSNLSENNGLNWICNNFHHRTAGKLNNQMIIH